MKIDRPLIESVLNGFFRRCEAAKAAGGIAHRDRVDGMPVPSDWVLDPATEYWLPPNVTLF